MSNPLDDAVHELSRQMNESDGPAGPVRVWEVDPDTVQADVEGATASKWVDGER